MWEQAIAKAWSSFLITVFPFLLFIATYYWKCKIIIFFFCHWAVQLSVLLSYATHPGFPYSRSCLEFVWENKQWACRRKCCKMCSHQNPRIRSLSSPILERRCHLKREIHPRWRESWDAKCIQNCKDEMKNKNPIWSTELPLFSEGIIISHFIRRIAF